MARTKKEGGIDDWAEKRRQELQAFGNKNSQGSTPSTPRIQVRKVSIGAQGRRLQTGVGGTASRRHAFRAAPPGSKKKK